MSRRRHVQPFIDALCNVERVGCALLGAETIQQHLTQEQALRVRAAVIQARALFSDLIDYRDKDKDSTK